MPFAMIQTEAKEIAGLSLEKFGLLLNTSYTENRAAISIGMITVFIGNCNHISQSFYDSVINKLQLHRLRCSCGHHGCLTVHGYYKRTVKLPEGDQRLRICRVKCSACGATHALLLSSIVPYSRIRLCDQHMICTGYESRDDPKKVCDINPSIDENNVKSVVRKYKRFWREKLRSLRITLSPLTGLIYSCFSDYSAQFMQIRKTFNSLYLTPT